MCCLIRLASEFSADDTPLLEAVGSQFARNLEARKLFEESARNAITQLLFTNRQQDESSTR